jgi:hypothetical protein
MTKRKLLLLVFTNEPCKRNHAFMHAIDLGRQGHEIRIILEGEATRCLAECEGRFGELFAAAVKQGILAGACRTASHGCSTNDSARDVAALAIRQGIPLLDDMDGHAATGDYISEGFELIVY